MTDKPGHEPVTHKKGSVMSTVTFVESLPTATHRGRPLDPRWNTIADALKAAPGRWALIERGAKAHRSQLARIVLASRGTFEVKYRAGDVYARYTPTVTTEG